MAQTIELRQVDVMKALRSQQFRTRRFLPVLGIFAGGAVHSILPHGSFGVYDTLVRVSITALVAGSTALALGLVFRSPPPT
jgi:hypothetical protein